MPQEIECEVVAEPADVIHEVGPKYPWVLLRVYNTHGRVPDIGLKGKLVLEDPPPTLGDAIGKIREHPEMAIDYPEEVSLLLDAARAEGIISGG